MPPESEPAVLVVTADDFGRSPGVNAAIAEAHDRGVVTAASVMAGGVAFDEAAALAASRPRLSIGVHVTLCDGTAVLPPAVLEGLAGPDGRLEPSPARAGIRYGLRPRLLAAIGREIGAQIDRVRAAGLRPRAVDAHHHLHVHPWIFPIVCREASARGIRWVRVPSGAFRAGRLLEWSVFGILGGLGRRAARRRGMMTARRVHGLGLREPLDEAALIAAVGRIRSGTHEIFSHPDLDSEEGRRELQALISPRVADAARAAGIRLAGWEEPPPPTRAGAEEER